MNNETDDILTALGPETTELKIADDMSLSASEIELFAHKLPSAPMVPSLTISGINPNVSSADMTVLVRPVINHPGIVKLDLSKNNFQTIGFATRIVREKYRLHTLDLSGNKRDFDTDSYVSFIQAVAETDHLAVLKMHGDPWSVFQKWQAQIAGRVNNLNNLLGELKNMLEMEFEKLESHEFGSGDNKKYWGSRELSEFLAGVCQTNCAQAEAILQRVESAKTISPDDIKRLNERWPAVLYLAEKKYGRMEAARRLIDFSNKAGTYSFIPTRSTFRRIILPLAARQTLQVNFMGNLLPEMKKIEVIDAEAKAMEEEQLQITSEATPILSLTHDPDASAQDSNEAVASAPAEAVQDAAFQPPPEPPSVFVPPVVETPGFDAISAALQEHSPESLTQILDDETSDPMRIIELGGNLLRAMAQLTPISLSEVTVTVPVASVVESMEKFDREISQMRLTIEERASSGGDVLAGSQGAPAKKQSRGWLSALLGKAEEPSNPLADAARYVGLAQQQMASLKPLLTQMDGELEQQQETSIRIVELVLQIKEQLDPLITAAGYKVVEWSTPPSTQNLPGVQEDPQRSLKLQSLKSRVDVMKPARAQIDLHLTVHQERAAKRQDQRQVLTDLLGRELPFLETRLGLLANQLAAGLNASTLATAEVTGSGKTTNYLENVPLIEQIASKINERLGQLTEPPDRIIALVNRLYVSPARNFTR